MRGADFRAVDIAPAPHALVATLDAVAGLLGPTGLVVGGWSPAGAVDQYAISAAQRAAGSWGPRQGCRGLTDCFAGVSAWS